MAKRAYYWITDAGYEALEADRAEDWVTYGVPQRHLQQDAVEATRTWGRMDTPGRRATLDRAKARSRNRAS